MRNLPDSIYTIARALHAMRESRPRIFYSAACPPDRMIVAEPDALWTNTMKVVIANPVHRALITEHLPDVEEFIPSPVGGKLLT